MTQFTLHSQRHYNPSCQIVLYYSILYYSSLVPFYVKLSNKTKSYCQNPVCANIIYFGIFNMLSEVHCL